MVPSAGQCQESNWAALLTEHPLGSCPELQAMAVRSPSSRGSELATSTGMKGWSLESS